VLRGNRSVRSQDIGQLVVSQTDSKEGILSVPVGSHCVYDSIYYHICQVNCKLKGAMTADGDDSLVTVLANEGLLVYSCASRMGSAPASATFRDWQREMCQSKCVRAVCALQLHHQHCHGFSTCSLARTADLKTSNRDSHSGTRSRSSFAWSLRLRRRYHREYVQQDDSFRPQSLLAR
jgi:hypothetical protein